jgi:hypothetical protein
MSTTNLAQPNETLPLPFVELHQPRRKECRKRTSERRTASASLDAFEAIKRRRVQIYKPILEVVAPCGPEPRLCLTAREILRALKARGVLPGNAERNAVSPRLTELLEAGCVENPAEYLKSVPGDSSAGVWRITERGLLLLEHLRSKTGRRGTT